MTAHRAFQAEKPQGEIDLTETAEYLRQAQAIIRQWVIASLVVEVVGFAAIMVIVTT